MDAMTSTPTDRSFGFTAILLSLLSLHSVNTEVLFCATTNISMSLRQPNSSRHRRHQYQARCLFSCLGISPQV